MIVAATGHRPGKIGNDRKTSDRLVEFARVCLRELSPSTVITGMAVGWDTAIAKAALAEKIEYHAYVPFRGQETHWPYNHQATYKRLLAAASKVIYCSDDGYVGWKMQYRNTRMVNALPDPEDRLLALWNGSDGGTANCLQYARMKIGESRIVNVWDRWEAFR